MANLRKEKGRDVEEEEKEKEEEGKAQKSEIVEARPKRRRKANKGEGRPKARQTVGKFGMWLFLLLILEQNWLSVSAAGEGPQRKTEAVMRMQQEVQIKESRWAEATPKRWKQPKGEDRIEMKKEARVVRCALLNGLAWSTEMKYMRRYKGKCDIFFGIEHRLRTAEMEEQFIKEAKEGWSFAANAARITDETTGSEDR